LFLYILHSLIIQSDITLCTFVIDQAMNSICDLKKVFGCEAHSISLQSVVHKGSVLGPSLFLYHPDPDKICHSKKNLIIFNLSTLSMVIDSESLEEAKYLGLTIRQDLKWKNCK
jgi:hypothetical protein